MEGICSRIPLISGKVGSGAGCGWVVLLCLNVIPCRRLAATWWALVLFAAPSGCFSGAACAALPHAYCTYIGERAWL